MFSIIDIIIDFRFYLYGEYLHLCRGNVAMMASFQYWRYLFEFIQFDTYWWCIAQMCIDHRGNAVICSCVPVHTASPVEFI
jgi:hypothetical protein